MFIEFNTLLEHCQTIELSTYGTLGGFFLTGYLGSMTHCTTMCGPFVIAQSGHLERLRSQALIPYHAGRITTYTVLALILSLFVDVVAMIAPMRLYVATPVLLFAGLLFLTNAFPSLQQIFPWAARLSFPAPQRTLGKLFTKTNNRYFTGILLGFMPCGLALSAMLAASAASTTLHTALYTISFGIGTMPMLILTAIGANKLKTKFTNNMQLIKSLAYGMSSIWLFSLAGWMVLKG